MDAPPSGDWADDFLRLLTSKLTSGELLEELDCSPVDTWLMLRCISTLATDVSLLAAASGKSEYQLGLAVTSMLSNIGDVS